MGKYVSVTSFTAELHDDPDIDIDDMAAGICRQHALDQGYTPSYVRSVDWYQFTQADIDLGMELFANGSHAGDWRARVVIEVEEDEPIAG